MTLWKVVSFCTVLDNLK